MAQFIHCFGGVLVNLDAVARIIPKSRKDETYSLLASTGDLLGETSGSRIEELDGILVPAAPGAFVYIIDMRFSAEEVLSAPTPENVFVSKSEVLAWRIRSGSNAAPVLLEQIEEGDFVWTLIPLLDGSLLEIDLGAFPSLDAAKKQFLSYWSPPKHEEQTPESNEVEDR